MDLFVKYNEATKQLSCDNQKLIPNICQRCIEKQSQKEIIHYKQLEEGKITICPKGFYSIKFRNEIITCLTPIGCRGIKELKKQKQSIDDLIILKEEKLLELLKQYYETKEENERLHACIHDLKNITPYFNSMEFKIRRELEDLVDTNDNIVSMLELYNLMNYRLSLVGKLPEQGYQKKNSNLHAILLKLIRILSFKAKNKKVNFELEPIEKMIIGSEHLYLAFFTLIDNAVKYAPPNSKISIYFKSEKDYTYTYIENIGPTIDDDEILRITQMGYRGRHNDYTGSGVGLSIFKEICDKCNYEYSFDKKDLNKNQSLFTACIKLQNANEKQ